MSTAEATFTEFTDDQKARLRGWSNRVRAPKGAVILDRRRFVAHAKEVTVSLYQAAVSDGFQTDYQRVVRWFVEVWFTDGIRRYVRGRPFSTEAAARRFYAAVS